MGRFLGPGCGLRSRRGSALPPPGTLPCPGRSLPRLPSHTSHPALTPSPRPVITHESARGAPDYGLISDFCLRESEDTTLVQYSLEQRGVWNRRHSVLASDLAGVSVYWLTCRRNRRALPCVALTLRSGWGVGSWAIDFWGGKAFCLCSWTTRYSNAVLRTVWLFFQILNRLASF